MEIIRITANDSLMQNSYLICSKTATILIDCGIKLDAARKEYANHFNSQKDLKIDAILLTHSHFDHSISLEEFVNEYNCPVYASGAAKENLQNPVINASSLFGLKLEYAPENLVLIKTEKTFSIGDIKITPIFTPGHTSCSICYIIENNLFSGDTLFFSSYGRTDLPSGNAPKMMESLEKLSLQNYSICYPGHGIPFYKQN